MSSTAHVTHIVELFTDAGAVGIEAARQLRIRLTDYPETDVDHASIKRLEQRGDEIIKGIFHELLRTEDSSFDRPELYALASAVDDVVDHIEHVSDLLDLYRVEAAMQQAIDQCDVLVRASGLLASALAAIGDPTQAEELLVLIKQAEDDGDALERRAIAALFEHDQISPRVIIQWKDIFEGLEAAIDACERSALIIGNMMLRAR